MTMTMRRKTYGLALFLLCLCAFFAAGGQAAQRRALLIGNNEYAAHGLNDLGGAPYNDVLLMHSVLSQPGGVSAQNITRVHDADKKGMLGAIQSAFHGATEDDLSIFYYSGHGALSENGKTAYLCAIGKNPSQWLSMKELKRALDKIPGSKAIILDSCHSGGVLSSKAFLKAQNAKYTGAAQAAFSGAGAKGRYYVLTASSMGSETYISREWGASFFTAALAGGSGVAFQNGREGFAVRPGGYQADTNSDGNITLEEMYAYIDRDIRQSSYYDTGVRVYPRYSSLVLVNYPKGQTGRTHPVAKLEASPYSADIGGKGMKFGLTMRRHGQVEVAVYRQDELGPHGAPYKVIYKGSLAKGSHTFSWDMRSARGKKQEGDFALWVRAEGNDDLGLLPAQFHITSSKSTNSFQIEVPPKPFVADGIKEISIRVSHKSQMPGAYDVRIETKSGKVVRRLAQNDPRRTVYLLVPQKEIWKPDRANFFFWDGRDGQGRQVPTGTYYVRVLSRGGAAKVQRERKAISLRRVGDPKISSLTLSRRTLVNGTKGTSAKLSGKTRGEGALFVEVVSAKGRVVRTLTPKVRADGGFSAVWDGRLENGASAPSGKYSMRASLRAKDGRSTQKSAGIQVRAQAKPKPAQMSYLPGRGLSIVLQNRAEVSLRIEDEGGRILAELPGKTYAPGSHVLKVSLPAGAHSLHVEMRSSKSGMYAPTQVFPLSAAPKKAA